MIIEIVIINLLLSKKNEVFLQKYDNNQEVNTLLLVSVNGATFSSEMLN